MGEQAFVRRYAEMERHCYVEKGTEYQNKLKAYSRKSFTRIEIQKKKKAVLTEFGVNGTATFDIRRIR